jgi:hypothetical protein
MICAKIGRNELLTAIELYYYKKTMSKMKNGRDNENIELLFVGSCFLLSRSDKKYPGVMDSFVQMVLITCIFEV